MPQPVPPPAAPRPPHKGSGSWGWLTVVVLALAGGAGWWWYQHRDIAPSAVAGGDTDAASAVTAEGSILVDARPWGRIEKVTATANGEAVSLPAGSTFTPRVATLPAGSYEITVSHPDAGSRSCQVEIQADTRKNCEVRFFETDPNAYFQELGW